MHNRSISYSILFSLFLVGDALAFPEPNGPERNLNEVVPPELFDKLQYRQIGPYRGGRSTAGVGVPGSPHTFYMGTTGGGVWKTDDAGETWTNTSDGFFEAGSIGAIAVADSDPNVVLVGTGSNAPRGNVSPGVGVYKSTDGGKTWAHMGLPEAGQIGRIRIHPNNAEWIYVAALGHIFGPNEERGVFRSTDGGQSWKKILYVSEKTGCVDLTMDIVNPRKLYAAMWTAERKPWTFVSGSEEGGIYKSTDGGETWKKLSGGLPEGVVGKIGVSVSPVNPKIVWALVEAENGGLFKSEDGGDSWKLVNKERKLRQRAWYYSRVYADPVDENTVYALNTSFYRSVDGGKTFESIRVLHGDCHDLWINPTNPRIMLQTNDGGAHVTLNGGSSWSTLNNQPTAEIYRLTVDNQHPYRIYGSQQDNTTISIPSEIPQGALTPYEFWRDVGGCESGHIAVDPRDFNIVYAGCYGGSISQTNLKMRESRSILVYPQLQLGQAPQGLKYRFQWNAPIRLSPHNPDRIYHTSQVVHTSSDAGHSWSTISPDLSRNDKSKQGFAGEPITQDNTGVEVYGTIFAFEESPHRAGVLWAGTDDGRVHLTQNGGAEWEEITPPAMPEWSTVNMIELSAASPSRAYLAVHRYRLDDFSPYIYRTNDSGNTWESLANGENGIPADHFVRVVREDPERPELLYAGTEFGLYISFDSGEHWQSLQLNLPRTPITDLAVHQGDLVVATQGRSFWILDHLNVLRQVSPDSTKPILFKPAKTYRSTFSQAGQQEHTRIGASSPNGVVVHYYLPEESTDLRIDIQDSDGNTVCTFSPEQDKEEEEGKSLFSPPPNPSAPAKKGLNQLVWDLRYSEFNIVKDAVIWGSTGGPKALPGQYRIRVTSGVWSAELPFEILADPNSDVGADELLEQFEMMILIRARLDKLYDTVRRIRSIRTQIDELVTRIVDLGHAKPDVVDSILDKLNNLENKMVQTKSESRQDPLNYPPMLDNQLVYLYGYVGGGDGRPTEGAKTRLADLEKELQMYLDQFHSIVEVELAEFEGELARLKIPRVILPR